MNHSYLRIQDDFLYRLELVACNLAILTLSQFSSFRTWIQRGVRLLIDYPIPLWVGGMAISGIIGMLSGFSFYCFLAFTR